MKKLLLRIAIVLFVGAMSIEGASAADASLATRIEDCFRAHGYLMEKPGLRNAITCWRAHSNLMERR
jgi:hypothetical protein